MNKTELFLHQYQDIITTALEHNHSEKQIYSAIYSKELSNYLRKGINPRLNELNQVIDVIKMHRSEEFEYDIKSLKRQWVWHSEPHSCPICQERDGRIYDKKPEPAHPNCNCEIEETDEEKTAQYMEDYKERLIERDNMLQKLDEGTKTHGDREKPKDPNKPSGYCSRKITDTLQTVFGDKYKRPPKAKDSGKSLEDVGFQKIPEGKNYEARKGDVKVYQPHGIPDKNGEIKDNGHVQIFDGEKWVSDYNQNTSSAINRGDKTGIYPNQNYKDHEDSQIYRYPKWQEWE